MILLKFNFAGTSIKIWGYWGYYILQVIPSDLEGNFSIFFRRIYFPFNAVGMPSLNNNVRNATFFISNLVCTFSPNICSVHLFPFLPSMFSAFQIQSLGFYGWFWRENAAHLLKPKAFKCTWVELGFSDFSYMFLNPNIFFQSEISLF